MAAKFRKISIRILVVLLIFVTAVLAARAILNYTTGKKLERYLAQAKADGVALRVKDLVPNCPDADNGARLWKAAEALLLVEKDDNILMSKTIESFYTGLPFDNTAKEKLSRLTEKNKKVLDLIAEAAERPCFRYRDWTGSLAYDAKIPPAISLIKAIRLLAIDAVLHAEKGAVGQALEESRSGMRFSSKLLDEPVLLDMLIALAVRKAVQISFDRIASGCDLDPEGLARWVKEMDPGPWRSRFFRCLPGEKALMLEVCMEVIKGRPETVKDFYGSGAYHRAVAWLLRPLLKAQVLTALTVFPELESMSERPYYEQRDLVKKYLRDEAPQSWPQKLLRAYVPEIGAMFLKEASFEAMMLTARAGLACKIYKSKTGRYPDTLDALVPDILSEVPIDPFTGKPLVYKIANGELLIYSLGSNQKDDGGRMTYEITKIIMDKDDDWTWRERIHETPKK